MKFSGLQMMIYMPLGAAVIWQSALRHLNLPSSQCFQRTFKVLYRTLMWSLELFLQMLYKCYIFVIQSIWRRWKRLSVELRQPLGSAQNCWRDWRWRHASRTVAWIILWRAFLWMLSIAPPNAVTMAAVKEARENKNLETINLDNLEEFIESL